MRYFSQQPTARRYRQLVDLLSDCLEQAVKLRPQDFAAVLKVLNMKDETKRKQDEAATGIRHGHYLIHANGTVTDTRNGLMWKRCAEGQTWDGKTCVGTANGITWNDAMPGGIQKSWPAFAGYDDWRVPTIEELRTLVYCSSGKPKFWNDDNTEHFLCDGDYKRSTIDPTVFPNTDLWFWSASSVASDSTGAWYLGFYYGCVYWNLRSYASRVRLVRGGQ